MGEKKRARIPLTVNFGAALILFGGFPLFVAPEIPVLSVIALGAGVILLCTGLIQHSIERSRG